MLKKLAIALLLIILLSLIIVPNPISGKQPLLLRFYVELNTITIDKAKKLAESCQIKQIIITHSRIIEITQVQGLQKKFLEDKFSFSENSGKTYDSDYEQFFELLRNSETKCGLRVVSGRE